MAKQLENFKLKRMYPGQYSYTATTSLDGVATAVKGYVERRESEYGEWWTYTMERDVDDNEWCGEISSGDCEAYTYRDAKAELMAAGALTYHTGLGWCLSL